MRSIRRASMTLPGDFETVSLMKPPAIVVVSRN